MPKEKSKSHSYTIALIPEDGSETRAFDGVTRTQLILALSGLFFFGFIVSGLFVAFSPVRLLIPGYAEPESYWKQLRMNQEQLDSLNVRVLQLDFYNQKLKMLLGAMPDSATKRADDFKKSPPEPNVQVAETIKGYAMKQNAATQATLLQQPNELAFVGSIVRGKISQGFLPEKSHYGIDIATALNEPVGALADGVVVFADWTNNYGWSIVIQHGAFTSFYKHCSKLFLREAEFVRRGQTIALTGNTGTESSGVHLHFEIWKDGLPLNPLDFLILN